MAPKILLVGNCQVRPIEFLLRHLNNAEETNTIIVHLANDSEREEYEHLLNSADIIVSQKIQDNYPCQTVRSSKIKEEHPTKTIFIPNLFYKGYTPDLRYYRLKGKGTLDGPLGDYHSSIILNCWKDGKTIEDTIQAYRSNRTWKKYYQNVAHESLVEYKHRENLLDIKLASFIEENLQKQQLFFTFNHPSKLLLTELVNKIATHLELRQTGNDVEVLAEPLDRFQIPIHPFTQKQLGLKFEGPTKFLGAGIRKKDPNERKTYSLKRLISRFFQHYSSKRDVIIELGVRQ